MSNTILNLAKKFNEMQKNKTLKNYVEIINSLNSDHVQLKEPGDWLLPISCRLPEALKPSIDYLQKTGFNSFVNKEISEPGTWIFNIVNLLTEELKVACSLVALKFPADKIQFSTQAIKDIFGGLHPGHGFTCECDTYLPNLTEPQLVSAIAEVLKAQNRTETESINRIKGFLHALDMPQPFQDSIKLVNNPEQINISYEIGTGNKKRRIDLLISWTENNGKKFCVIVEAKFGHIVTTGQLPDYRGWAKKNYNEVHLILLTPEGKRSNRNREWHPVSWWRLLLRWEKLCRNSPEDMCLVKSLIWKKI